FDRWTVSSSEGFRYLSRPSFSPRLACRWPPSAASEESHPPVAYPCRSQPLPLPRVSVRRDNYPAGGVGLSPVGSTNYFTNSECGTKLQSVSETAFHKTMADSLARLCSYPKMLSDAVLRRKCRA